jgi:hypothetical protein
VSGTDRIAAGWWASNSFTVNVNLLDGQAHVISFYFLDWDSVWRSERIQLIDAATGSVLDTQTVQSFHGGVYLSWQASGNLVIKVTHLGGANAVLSGLFFDAPNPLTTAARSDLGMQTVTVGVPGGQGQSFVSSAARYVAQNPVTGANPSAIGWAAGPADGLTDTRPSMVVNLASDGGSTVATPLSMRSRSIRVPTPRSFGRVRDRQRLLN